MAKNLCDKFKDAAARFSGKTAIEYKRGDEWACRSYGELGCAIEALSAFLTREGIKKGDRVALALDNRPEWPVIFFATVSIGAVVVPINPESSSEEAENILKDSGSAMIFLNSVSPFLERIVSARIQSLKKIIKVDSDEFRDAISNQRDVEKRIEILPSELACILYTSGTTAVPKGVMLSHRNLLSNCESLYSLNLVTAEDSVVSVLPLHHTYPLTVTTLLPLLHGGRIIYPGAIRGDVVMKAMEERSPTIFVAVPQIFHAFHQKIAEHLKKTPFPLNLLLNSAIDFLYMVREKTGLNLSPRLLGGLHKRFGRRMRLFVSGGAKLGEDVERDLFKWGFTILEGYGLTETSPVLSSNPLKRPKIGSVGPAIPGVELKILNPDEKGIGEVAARGPNIMNGYYKRKDLTDEVIREGWFHTGDLGFIDKDGYLFLTGRSKDIIVLSSGLNIDPGEIEEAYSKAAPVKEMCVFEAPSKEGAKEDFVLWAVVVPDLEYFRRFGEINLRSVIKERFDNVSRELPPSKRLMGFHITLEALPRTPLGKIKRFIVREKYASKIAAEKSEAAVSKELTREDIAVLESETAGKIMGHLKKELKIKKEINLDDTLELDLGIDSLGRIELASALEGIFNIKVEGDVIGKAFTVKDLILGVEALLKGIERVPAGDKGEGAVRSADYWKSLFRVLPREENLKKINLKPGFWSWLAGAIFLLPIRAYFKAFCYFRVEGKDNVPEEGACILYANHASYFDGFLVACALPRSPRMDLFFVGFRPYFDVPIIRNLLRIGRIIPLDFSSHLLEALRSCYFVLKNGKKLCVFPEGLRSLDGKTGGFKKGFGILAKETGVRLVPVFLKGAYEAWPRTSKFPRPHPIKAIIGKAVLPDDLEKEGLGLGAEDSYAAICAAARQRLEELRSR